MWGYDESNDPTLESVFDRRGDRELDQPVAVEIDREGVAGGQRGVARRVSPEVDTGAKKASGDTIEDRIARQSRAEHRVQVRAVPKAGHGCWP